jgi:hypothetical protein
VVGGLGVLAALTAVVFGWASAIPAALVLLATEYVIGIGTGGHEDVLEPAAPLVAGGLLLVAELAYWSLELRGPGREERTVLLRRLVALAVLSVLAVALGSFVVVVTAAPLGGGLAWDVVGVAAAAATLAVVAVLARRDLRG